MSRFLPIELIHSKAHFDKTLSAKCAGIVRECILEPMALVMETLHTAFNETLLSNQGFYKKSGLPANVFLPKRPEQMTAVQYKTLFAAVESFKMDMSDESCLLALANLLQDKEMLAVVKFTGATEKLKQSFMQDKLILGTLLGEATPPGGLDHARRVIVACKAVAGRILEFSKVLSAHPHPDAAVKARNELEIAAALEEVNDQIVTPTLDKLLVEFGSVTNHWVGMIPANYIQVIESHNLNSMKESAVQSILVLVTCGSN
jgi:hypothetical protein